MATKKKPAKASKQKSQPKAPAKKQPKKKVLPPGPHTTHKHRVEEVSSDDESDEEPPQKSRKRMQKVAKGNDSDINVNVNENGNTSDEDDAHGGQQLQSEDEVHTVDLAQIATLTESSKSLFLLNSSMNAMLQSRMGFFLSIRQSGTHLPI